MINKLKQKVHFIDLINKYNEIMLYLNKKNNWDKELCHDEYSLDYFVIKLSSLCCSICYLYEAKSSNFDILGEELFITLNKIIDIINQDEQNTIHHFNIRYGNLNSNNNLEGSCSCGKKFKTQQEIDEHHKEVKNQPIIYKGFDSIMEALLEGKKLKPKNHLLFIECIHYSKTIEQIIQQYNAEEDNIPPYDLMMSIYKGLEFEEYQKPKQQQLKEYTIQELEQKLGEKIKIIGDKNV